MLEVSEKQARVQYESMLKERRGHGELMANLHSIQNNLERSDFETKTRLGAQIQALEREVCLLKDKLHAEEERKNKMMEAYDVQVGSNAGGCTVFRIHTLPLSYPSPLVPPLPFPPFPFPHAPFVYCQRYRLRLRHIPGLGLAYLAEPCIFCYSLTSVPFIGEGSGR